MITAYIYRYAHPHDPTRFIYVGQEQKEGERDKSHRKERTYFSQRFKRAFPNTSLPMPVRRQVNVPTLSALNEEETIDMFIFHTWRGYPGGMNITIPGDINYTNLGSIGGLKRGPQAKESGQLAATCSLGGQIGGQAQVKKKLGMFAPEHIGKGGRTGAGGRKTAELGLMSSLGLSGVGLHTRWHINRNISKSDCPLCR